MTAGKFAHGRLQVERLDVPLFAQWFFGCQMYCRVVLPAHRFSVRGRCGWESGKRNPAYSFQSSSALRESESSCQNSTTGSFAVLLSSFQGRVETSESYYCAYFEALLCKHMEQSDEVHFTVRLWCYTWGHSDTVRGAEVRESWTSLHHIFISHTRL